MGFRDSVSVLFEKEVYEADLSGGSYTIQEEGSPFALINNAVKASTGKELSSEAYRQVCYVNDISFSNEQVLMERAVNGSLGESMTGYSYGLWRESYSVEAGAGTRVSVGMETGSGIYYYTGTGSVANLVTGSGIRGYSYGPGGVATVYGQGSLESRTNTQAGSYGYNGEYTHGSLGLQYLRARYLKVETGTFTSRDTYAGRVRDIISQNRYTYAENNPVTFADPSGHKITIGTTIGNMFGGGRNTGRNSGIGGIIGNAAQTVVDKIESTVRTAQNTTRNTINRTTGNHTAAITNTTENIVAQATGGITGTFSGGSPSANDSGGVTDFVESDAAQVEVIRCEAYENCKNDVREIIRNRNKQETMMLYSMGRMDDYINGRNVSEFTLSMSERYVAAHGEYNQLPSYGINNGVDWDRYDTYILAWTNYWNERLKDVPNSKVDPEIVKAMIAQESSMGTKDGYGGASGQNGKRDIMQTLYEYDGAIYTLSKMRFRENYNKTDSDYEKFRIEGTGAYGIPDEGYGFLKPIFSSDGTYDKDAVNTRMSTVAGIRYLSYTTKLKDGDPLEGVGRYNGGGDSNYIEHVFEHYKNGRNNEGLDPFEKYNWKDYINDK